MKTLFFCNLVPVKTGAFEALLAAVGAEFAKAGDEFVAVFGGEPIPTVAQSLRQAGVRWHILAGWTDGTGHEHAWRFALPAAALVRRERPDVAVVHFGNELPSLAASLLTRGPGGRRPRWVWQQDQQIRDPGRLGRHVSRIRLLASGMDHFLAVYEGGRQSLLKRGIPAGRITVIHNSIAPFTSQRPAGWLRRELNVPAEAVVMVSTGSLIHRKRIDFLLQACARLNAAGLVDWRLLAIGDGPCRSALETQAHDLGIASRVQFLGLRNDVRDILAEADLLVHASLAETCTYAVTESMAAGIPAIVTEAGAAREQIDDGVTGFVVAVNDVNGFAERMALLCGDEGRRKGMGALAQSRWSRGFLLAEAARRYHDMYSRLASLGHQG